MKPRPDLPPGPYLVVGLARSGVAAALALHRLGAQVVGVDAGEPDGLEPLRGGRASSFTWPTQGTALLERAKTARQEPGGAGRGAGRGAGARPRHVRHRRA